MHVVDNIPRVAWKDIQGDEELEENYRRTTPAYRVSRLKRIMWIIEDWIRVRFESAYTGKRMMIHKIEVILGPTIFRASEKAIAEGLTILRITTAAIFTVTDIVISIVMVAMTASMNVTAAMTN